jgi:hypothetical protein
LFSNISRYFFRVNFIVNTGQCTKTFVMFLVNRSTSPNQNRQFDLLQRTHTMRGNQFCRTFPRYICGYCYTCVPDTHHQIFNFSNDYQLFSFSPYSTPRNSYFFFYNYSVGHLLFLYPSINPMLDIFSWQSLNKK